MLTTPLQLANATAAISNMGKRYKPRMLHAINDPETNNLKLSTPSTLEKVPIVSKQNWLSVTKSMEKVVHSIFGTARGISKNLTYRIAGKTGTAQVFGIAQDAEYKEEEIAKKLRDHALFIAYAPVKNPQIAVALIVENGGSGGTTAAPIARKVMDQYLLDHSKLDVQEKPVIPVIPAIKEQNDGEQAQ